MGESRRRRGGWRLASAALGLLLALPAAAQSPDPAGLSVNLGQGEPGSYARLLLLFAAAALAPAVLAVITSFARIAVVLFFPKGVLGTARERWLKWLP